MIKLGKYDTEDLDGMRFVARAIYKGKDRPPLRYIYVDGNEAMATDGHRLHIYQPEKDFQDGFYEVYKNTQTMFWLERLAQTEHLKFPEIDWFFPNSFRWEYNLLGASVDGDYVKLSRRLHRGDGLNYQHFSDMVKGEPFVAHYAGLGKPVYFTNHTRYGLIMPFRV